MCIDQCFVYIWGFVLTSLYFVCSCVDFHLFVISWDILFFPCFFCLCVCVSTLFQYIWFLFLSVFAGILPAVWRGQFLQVGSTTGRAGALEEQARMREGVSGVWVCCDTCGSRFWWEDQCERPPGCDWGGFSWGERYHVQFPDHQLEPGLQANHSLSTQWVLPSQLCPGTKNTDLKC